MWKLFGKNEDEYLVDADGPADSTATPATPATSIDENQMASAPAAPAADLSAPVMPPAAPSDAAQPSTSTPTPDAAATPAPAEPTPAPAPEAAASAAGDASTLTPNVEAAAPTPAETDEHAAQPAGLDATPAPAAVPGVDTTQAVMDHQMDGTGSATPAADPSTLMSPGASNDGPPVPGVAAAGGEDEIHTADHDIQLIQHVLQKMANDTHLSLNDAVSQAHDEISH